MSIRFFTDSHHAPTRPSDHPFRHCDRSLSLIKSCFDTVPKECEAIIFGGDAIMATYDEPHSYHESLMQEFGAAAQQSPVPFHAIAGNHEYDYFRDLSTLSALTGISYGNKVVDLADGQRLILMNDQFHCDDMLVLYPYTDESLDFVQKAIESAPTNLVTLVTHTPINDYDSYRTQIILRDRDPEYNFRPNAADLRKILEDSGKNCLVLSGHTHYENFSFKDNVAYLTLQSLVEGVRTTEPETTFERWADITRNNDHDMHIRLHGHKGGDIHHRFPAVKTQKPTDPAAPSLTAE